MNHLTKIAFAASLMVASALWGYSGDTFVANLRQLRTNASEWFHREAPPATPEAPAPTDAAPTAAAPSANGMAAVAPQGQGANPFQQAAKNPYAQFMGNGKPASGALAKTLDSIRPGQVQETQEVKRNLYFEKLSQQLKQLQGDNQPAVAAAPKPEAVAIVPPEQNQAAVQANPFGASNPTGQAINPPMPPPGAAYQPPQAAADEGDNTEDDEADQPDEPEE